uniref:syntaxin-1A-like n=1 Tax=Myxine glutinosa TaxID=7769 RepID=UPI00358DF27F
MKDRLADLQNQAAETQSFLGAGSTHNEPDQKDEATNALFAKVDRMSEEMDGLEVLVNRLQEVQQNVLTDLQPKEGDKRELHRLRSDILSCCQRLSRDLKDLEKSIEEDGAANQTEAKIRVTLNNTLHTRFLELMKICNEEQAKYGDLSRDRIIRQAEISGQTLTPEQLDDMLESGNSSIFTQGFLQESSLSRAQLSEIQSRHSELLNLEKSIADVREIFLQVQTLVSDQGNMVNNIEKHILSTVDHTAKAKSELQVAKNNRKKACKKKIFLAIYLAVVLLIIAISLAISFS